MALSPEAQEELNAYKEALEKQYQNRVAEAPAPIVPQVQQLNIADVLRILVQHTRIPLESTALLMLDAIDREFAPSDDTDDETPA